MEPDGTFVLETWTGKDKANQVLECAITAAARLQHIVLGENYKVVPVKVEIEASATRDRLIFTKNGTRATRWSDSFLVLPKKNSIPETESAEADVQPNRAKPGNYETIQTKLTYKPRYPWRNQRTVAVNLDVTIR